MSGLRGPAAPSDVLTTPLKLYGRLVRLGTAWGLDQPFVTVGWRMSGLRVLVPGGGRLMDWNETPRQLRLQEQSTVFMVRSPATYLMFTFVCTCTCLVLARARDEPA